MELTKLGKTPKEIRLLTGWEIGKDNKWRYEMFDGDAKIKIPIEKLSIGKTYKLKDILDFPEIYEAYPSIANLAFQLNTRLNANGQYQSENKRLVMNPDKLKGNPVETISTMLHELQHAVQEKEGFARGTSEEQARAKLKEEYLRQKYENRNPFRRFREILGLPFTSTETLGESLANLERIADKSDFDIYERAAGEVEARNVEKRLSMSESERLNTLLSDTENISRDDQFIIRKQQVTNNEIIQRAKEAGISDAAIRKYLQDDKGLSVKQADDAVRLYNEKLRKEGLKKEGVKDISGKNAKRLYNALMYVKSARANRPKSMVIGREDKAGAIEGAIKRAYNTIGKLDKIMKKMSKPEYEKVMDELDKYLRGNKNANLPDDIKAVAFEMRTHLDNLSRKLIEVGAVPDVEFDNLPPNKKQELIDRAGSEADARAEYKTASENILGNIGEYLNRSYAVHTDKNWKDKVSEKVVEDAKNYLRKSMAKTVEIQAKKENRDLATMLEQEVNAVVDRLLDPNESRAFFSIGSTDAKKTGILTRRLDIAPEIRALTGEEMSPAKNYIISVQKIASLAAQQTFLNNVRETGLGVWLFENEADAPKGFRTRIASETSKTMNPLNGLYTSPEIAKAFNDTYKNPEGIAGDVIKIIDKAYLKPLGVVKYSKTILSLGTHSKNIIGNGFFMVANGYITKDFYDAGKVVWNEIKNGDNETLREKYIEYIEAGVINSNVAIKELKNILNNKVTTEQDFEKLVQDRLYGKNALKKIAEKAEMAYQMEDDYFKIVSYEVNKRQYSKALFKNSFENLTGKQQKEVKDIAKEITKNTLPNYERIAKIREFLKYMPIGSNFLSFHMEALRVSYNTIELALKEVKDPRTAAIGVRRLAGISAVVMFSSGLLGSLLGFGGDDEDEEDSVRKLLPYYSENSKINIASTSGNEIIYQDLSASSPYGAIEKAFIAYSRGESLDESMIGSLKEALGPFFADDIIISEFMKAYDVTSSQGFISREGGEAIAKFIYSTSKPGTITSSEKVFIDDRMSILDAAFGREIKLKEQGKLKEAFGQFTGFGYRAVKKDAVLKRKLYEIASVGFGDYKSGKARAASMDYSKRVREFKDGKVSEAEVEDAYKRSNKMYKEAINEAIEIYKSGLTLDVSNEKMKELMKSTGFSKDEIEYISRGETPEMKRKEPELSEYEKLLKKRSKR
ncbi:MAG: LPD23 domain-containing protein [Methylophilaceae bacterium]